MSYYGINIQLSVEELVLYTERAKLEWWHREKR